MTKKNLSLLRRSNNRTHRPAKTQSSEEEEGGDEQQLKANGRKFHTRRGSDAENEMPGKLYVDRSDKDDDWLPALSSAFKILFSMRISAAIWSAISDCDEVYNYWEPLHTLLYGWGFQTWEYSPVYAIRSWLYIYLHLIPAQPLSLLLGASKIGVFITLRCLLGLLNVAGDLCLYRAVAGRLGAGIARLFIAFSMLSAGMFLSSCAFLPSSFSMSLNSFALAAYLSRRWWWSITATAISAMIGWPFAAILGLPVAVEMLLVQPKKLATKFLAYASLAGVVLASGLVAVDSYFYGKKVLAPLNIVWYNIFTSHGPDLYGVEPMSYYVKNLLLNWNVAFPLALCAVPIAGVTYWRNWRVAGGKNWVPDLSLAFWRRFTPVVTISGAMVLWLAVFFLQPHKEERFLYPVYPMIALTAAIALDAIHRFGLRTFVRKRYSQHWYLAIGVVMGVFAVCALSRTIAMHRNFSAQIETYKSLNEHLGKNVQQRIFDLKTLEDPVKVCVGKEWYRFPGNFFIPDTIADRHGSRRMVRLEFIKSEFAGQLPKPFAAGKLPEITREIPGEMNDMNREEPTRYVPVEQCDFLIDLETGDQSTNEPDFMLQENTWRLLETRPFLLAGKSHWFFRAFYVPFMSDRYSTFGRYHILQRLTFAQG